MKSNFENEKLFKEAKTIRENIRKELHERARSCTSDPTKLKSDNFYLHPVNKNSKSPNIYQH
jgi:hypothetical protein